MVTIKAAGACSNPITEQVTDAHSSRLGPLEMWVYRKNKRWRWIVALDGEVLVEGRSRHQDGAMRACEAAAYRCYPSAILETP